MTSSGILKRTVLLAKYWPFFNVIIFDIVIDRDSRLDVQTYTILIRLIPQGTVYINLGQDRLEGPKAVDLNYCRQPTL